MQKTAYEMRISYWISDVCSSDLILAGQRIQHPRRRNTSATNRTDAKEERLARWRGYEGCEQVPAVEDGAALDPLIGLQATVVSQPCLEGRRAHSEASVLMSDKADIRRIYARLPQEVLKPKTGRAHV